MVSQGVDFAYQCTNAADRWADVLQDRFGFEIVRLVELAATKAAVEAACLAAIGELEDGDAFTLLYVGHAGRQPDAWSTELDEADGYDEGPALAHPNGLIGAIDVWRDDDIRAMLNQFAPGVKITCVFDMCYAGTATRSIQPRTLPEESMNHLLFASSAADADSYVRSGDIEGAGTIFETMALRALEKSGTGITAQDFFDRLMQEGSTGNIFPGFQAPQLEGPAALKNSRLFV